MKNLKIGQEVLIKARVVEHNKHDNAIAIKKQGGAVERLVYVDESSFVDDCNFINLDKLDPIVKKSVIELIERSKKGVEKYGTTLADNNTDDFLQHLKEELMDGINYVNKLQSDRKG